MRYLIYTVLIATSCNAQPVKKKAVSKKPITVFTDTNYGDSVLPSGVILLYNKWTNLYAIKEDSLHYFIKDKNGKPHTSKGGLVGRGHSGTQRIDGTIAWMPCDDEMAVNAFTHKDSSIVKTEFLLLYYGNKKVTDELRSAWEDSKKKGDFKPVHK